MENLTLNISLQALADLHETNPDNTYKLTAGQISTLTVGCFFAVTGILLGCYRFRRSLFSPHFWCCKFRRYYCWNYCPNRIKCTYRDKLMNHQLDSNDEDLNREMINLNPMGEAELRPSYMNQLLNAEANPRGPESRTEQAHWPGETVPNRNESSRSRPIHKYGTRVTTSGKDYSVASTSIELQPMPTTVNVHQELPISDARHRHTTTVDVQTCPASPKQGRPVRLRQSKAVFRKSGFN